MAIRYPPSLTVSELDGTLGHWSLWAIGRQEPPIVGGCRRCRDCPQFDDSGGEAVSRSSSPVPRSAFRLDRGGIEAVERCRRTHRAVCTQRGGPTVTRARLPQNAPAAAWLSRLDEGGRWAAPHRAASRRHHR